MQKHWWSDYPWRMIQTNLREIDMLDIDADSYVQEMLDMNATLAMINTSGIIASYETDLDFHFQSPYLKGDSLKKIIDKCHENGIKVIARTDFSKIRKEIYDNHHDWAYVSPQGEVENYNGDIHACICGDYQQKYSLKIIEETLKKLPVDGIFFNMGGFTRGTYSYKDLGICQCENCKRRFMDMFGLDLPLVDDDDDPTYIKYKVFRDRIVTDQRRRTVELINSIRDDFCIDRDTVVTFSGYRRHESNTEFLRALPKNPYQASVNTKVSRGSYPDFVSSSTTVDFVGFKYRHIAISPHQQKLRLQQSLANAGALDYYLIGRLDNHSDKSGYDNIRKVFTFHKNNEDVYVGAQIDTKTLLVDGEGSDVKGFVRMLSLGHYPFTMVEPNRLEAISLDSYTTVILPNVKYLSDAAVAKLNSFSGNVIATGMSGYYTEEYAKRDTQPITKLGMGEIISTSGDMDSAMLRINNPENYPTLKGTQVVYFGRDFIYSSPTTAKGELSLIPPHNYGPPERCYWSEESEIPGLYKADKGAYIPWYPGSLFNIEGHTNTLYFMWDLLDTYNVERIDGLNSQVEFSMTKTTSGDSVIHLVNISGHFGPSFLEPVQMSGLSFFVPNRSGMKASTLCGGNAIIETVDGGINITLDKLLDYEAIVITE